MVGAIIGGAVSLIQMGIGIAKGAKAKKETNKLLSQREAYKTPSQVTDILNATQSNAQSGFDASTLDYLNNQSDQAFASSISSAERMGGDPNALSTIFAKKIDAIKGVAAQDHQLSMANFSAYISAQNALASNIAAEQKSRQDILKDKIQAAAGDKAIASQQISAGLNTGIAALSAYETEKIYGNQNTGSGGYVPVTTNTTGYNPSMAPVSSSVALRSTQGAGIDPFRTPKLS